MSTKKNNFLPVILLVSIFIFGSYLAITKDPIPSWQLQNPFYVYADTIGFTTGTPTSNTISPATYHLAQRGEDCDATSTGTLDSAYWYAYLPTNDWITDVDWKMYIYEYDGSTQWDLIDSTATKNETVPVDAWVGTVWEEGATITSGNRYLLSVQCSRMGEIADTANEYIKIYWNYGGSSPDSDDSMGTRGWQWPDHSDPSDHAGFDGTADVYIYATYDAGVTVNPPASVSMDSLHNDYSAELDSIPILTTSSDDTGYDDVIVAWSTSGYPDSSNGGDTLMHTFSQSTVYYDTLTAFNQTEPYTLYVSTWQYDDVDGWSSRTTQSITFNDDITAPDPFDDFRVEAISYLDPDTVVLYYGNVDSTDFATAMVRYGTTIPTTTSEGTLAYQGSVTEGDTASVEITVSTEPDWIYFTVFAGDEIPNWSTGVTDSIYFPDGGGGGDRTNRMYEYLMGLQK